MSQTLGPILITRQEIQQRVEQLGQMVSRDYEGKIITIVAILKGSFIFLADLVRQIDPDIPVEMDFMSVTSYGNSLYSSGEVRIENDIRIPIEDKDVLIVEDIVDSGLTLAYVHKVLMMRHPRSLRAAALLQKPGVSQYNSPLDYVGFQVPDQYVVGYGLDAAQRFRNLPDIRVMEIS